MEQIKVRGSLDDAARSYSTARYRGGCCDTCRDHRPSVQRKEGSMTDDYKKAKSCLGIMLKGIDLTDYNIEYMALHICNHLFNTVCRDDGGKLFISSMVDYKQLANDMKEDACRADRSWEKLQRMLTYRKSIFGT